MHSAKNHKSELVQVLIKNTDKKYFLSIFLLFIIYQDESYGFIN